MDTYPSIHFDFQTNGTLCDRNLLDKLCVTDKIDYMRISVSATTAETYGKMVKNGDKLFDKLKSNLQMLSELKKEHNFEYYLHFIVTSKTMKKWLILLALRRSIMLYLAFGSLHINVFLMLKILMILGL